MSRITRSAKTLVTQILDRWEDASISNGDEPDGLGVHRQLVIAEPVAEQLFELMLPIAQHDRRIASLHLADEGSLTITFASDRHADLNDPFPLHEVEAVQKAPETDEVAISDPDTPEVEESPTEPEKTPESAKKAAAKKGDS